MYFGVIAANETCSTVFPRPSVLAALRETAKARSAAQGDYASALAERVMTEMQASGLAVHEWLVANKTAWVKGLPEIIMAGGFVAMLIGGTFLLPGFLLSDPEAYRARRRDQTLKKPAWKKCRWGRWHPSCFA